MIRRGVLALALLAGAAGGACREGVTRAQWDTIRAWLECIECQDGELSAVLSIGEPAVPILASVLKDLPADRKTRLASRFGAQWHALDTASPDSASFANRYVQNFVSVSRQRSARALAEMGEWDALRTALDSADTWGLQLRDRRVLQRLLFTSSTVLFEDGSVRGRVTDVDGAAVGRVNVRLRRCGADTPGSSSPRAGSCDGLAGPVWTVLTSRDGSYLFRNLPEGVYDAAPTPLPPTFSASSPGGLVVLLLGLADEAAADFELQP